MEDRKNAERREGHTQVCLWPGTVVGPDKAADFEQAMLEEFGARVQYLEEVRTFPDVGDDLGPVPGTGGRSDLLFAVHRDDVAGFAVPRLLQGIRWIEDVYGNGHGAMYPTRIAEYRSW